MDLQVLLQVRNGAKKLEFPDTGYHFDLRLSVAQTVGKLLPSLSLAYTDVVYRHEPTPTGDGGVRIDLVVRGPPRTEVQLACAVHAALRRELRPAAQPQASGGGGLASGAKTSPLERSLAAKNSQRWGHVAVIELLVSMLPISDREGTCARLLAEADPTAGATAGAATTTAAPAVADSASEGPGTDKDKLATSSIVAIAIFATLMLVVFVLALLLLMRRSRAPATEPVSTGQAAAPDPRFAGVQPARPGHLPRSVYLSAADGGFGGGDPAGDMGGGARSAWATPADPFGGFQAVAPRKVQVETQLGQQAFGTRAHARGVGGVPRDQRDQRNAAGAADNAGRLNHGRPVSPAYTDSYAHLAKQRAAMPMPSQPRRCSRPQGIHGGTLLPGPDVAERVRACTRPPCRTRVGTRRWMGR